MTSSNSMWIKMLKETYPAFVSALSHPGRLWYSSDDVVRIQIDLTF